MGLAFKDEYFRNYFFSLKKDLEQREMRMKQELRYRILKRENKKHFILLDKKSCEDICDLENIRFYDFWNVYEKRDVYPIVYLEKNHVFIEHLLDHLLLLKENVVGRKDEYGI